METLQIDKLQTYERVRAKYGSVLKFCKAHKASAPMFYIAVVENRGTKGRPAPEAVRIREILRAEGLLAEVPAEDGPAAANG